MNSSSFKTQSITSKSPKLKSKTDSDFNFDIDLISSKIRSISTIDNYSETSKTDKSSFKSKSIVSKSPKLKSKTDSDYNFDNYSETSKTNKSSIKSETEKNNFTSTSNSKFNWDFIEKQGKNTITIEKKNINITIDENNNIKINFM